MFDSVCAANFSKTPLGVNIFLNKILITNVSGKARPAQSGRSRALARFLPCFGRFCTFAPGKRLASHLHLTVTNWPPPRPRRAGGSDDATLDFENAGGRVPAPRTGRRFCSAAAPCRRCSKRWRSLPCIASQSEVMMVAVDFSPRMRVWWARVAERRLTQRSV